MPNETEMQRRLREIARADNARAMAELQNAAARHTADRLDRLAENVRRKAEMDDVR